MKENRESSQEVLTTLFKFTEDFNETTHVAPYGPNVFIENISLYFNSVSSIQDLLKEPQMVMLWGFQHSSKFFWVCS